MLFGRAPSEGVEIEDYAVIEPGFAPDIGICIGESVLCFGSDRFGEQGSVLSDKPDRCGTVQPNVDRILFERYGL